MAITLYHGSNGGYKTSSVVQNHIVPALEGTINEDTGVLEGRIVITNIRGVSLKRFYDAGVSVHSDSDIIYIDTDNTPEGKLGRRLISCFWSWAPQNALLAFDESGVMFPKSWRDKELTNLNNVFSELLKDGYKPTFEIEVFNRPDCFIEAFEMHRHKGWDIVLSAPNIKSIRDDIRDTSELAWRHRNAALIGFKGRYKAISHDPANNGTSASNVIESKLGKISQRTFNLYDSTTTGKATDTANASKSALASPRLLLALACATFALIYSFSSGGYDQLLGKGDKVTNGNSVANSAQANSNSVRLPLPSKSDSGEFDVVIYGEPIQKIYISGNVGNEFSFVAVGIDGNEYEIDLRQLDESGYFIIKKSGCHVLLISKAKEKSVYCRLSKSLSDEEYASYLDREIKYDDNFVEGQI